MSYQALARKWRPKTFRELVGQEHVVTALTNALTRNRLHHAYLLTGTRGVGKTTIARILAKSLNCITNGVTAEPCGTCAACTDIDAGRFVDLLELDAASNTGIDNMREVLDNARYMPTVGRFKVYLIDEVHMLSKAAFNSMLKTLEEPPAHVKFVLATTDPQKIPVTVLSRCLQFNLKQLSPSLIVEVLTPILAAEEVSFDAPALALIARAAHGSVRDALSLLDQAIAYGGGSVREDVVRTMLGAVDTEYVYRIVDALVANDGPALLAEVDAMAARSVSFASALEDLASLFHRLALVQAVPAAADTMEDGARVVALAGRLAPEMVQLAYQICVQGRADLPLAPDEATGFSMTLLRLLAFEPSRGTATAADEGRPAPGRPLSRGREAGAVSAVTATASRPDPRAIVMRDPEPGTGADARAAGRRRATGGAAHRSGGMAGIRGGIDACADGGATRGPDRAQVARRQRADARAAGDAQASRGQALCGQAQGRARRGDRPEMDARLRGGFARRSVACRPEKPRAVGAEVPHRGRVPGRAFRAGRARPI